MGRRFTEEEYLAFERTAEYKSEYHDGEMQVSYTPECGRVPVRCLAPT